MIYPTSLPVVDGKIYSPGEYGNTYTFEKFSGSLQEVELYGTQTNLDYLRCLTGDPVLSEGRVTTRFG